MSSLLRTDQGQGDRRDQAARDTANDLHPGIARYLGFSFLGADELVVLTEYFSEGSLRRHIRSLAEISWRAVQSSSRTNPVFQPASGAAVRPAQTAPPDLPLVRPESIRAYARQLVLALSFLHLALKMSHRRVSAACVFLHDNGTVCVLLNPAA